jgi:hypothetical protein
VETIRQTNPSVFTLFGEVVLNFVYVYVMWRYCNNYMHRIWYFLHHITNFIYNYSYAFDYAFVEARFDVDGANDVKSAIAGIGAINTRIPPFGFPHIVTKHRPINNYISSF